MSKKSRKHDLYKKIRKPLPRPGKVIPSKTYYKRKDNKAEIDEAVKDLNGDDSNGK